MGIQNVRFYQKCTVRFRNVPGKKYYEGVMLVETDQRTAIVQNPDRFIDLLREESIMVDSYVMHHEVRDAIKWIQDVIIGYMQNPESIDSYPKTRVFLKKNIVQFSVRNPYSVYRTYTLDVFRKK